jgi:hypothetical protein
MRKVLLVTVALRAISTAAFADETLKYRLVQHVVAIQQMSAPDADGHNLGIVQLAGVISLQDGTVAQWNGTGALDYINGTGPYTVYMTLTFSDGSALFVKEEGKTTTEGGKGTLTGVDTILGGKGRYAGAKGDGSGVGYRVTNPSGPVAGAGLYADVVLNIKSGGIATGK